MAPTFTFGRAFVSFVLLAIAAQAQKPFYIGKLLIEPGNNSGQCLTAASNNNGAAVTLQPCSAGNAAAQNWEFIDGAVKVFDKTKCLDVTDGRNVDGVKLQIWDCFAGSQNQRFWYTGDRRLAWTDHGKCTDVTDGKAVAGTKIQLWSCGGGNANQVWNTGYLSTALPDRSQSQQTGTNKCGPAAKPDCQTSWLNSAQDFCLWGPPQPNSAIGDTERVQVAWCTKSEHGARLIPDGTLTGVHFVKTKDYVQITGKGDLTKLNIKANDPGGELDPHGPDGEGNPPGGLLFGNTFGPSLQYHEWTQFIGANEFCVRACTGPNAARNCQHIYDVMGCHWNMPANYNSGFENCDADNDLPMGVYGTSTWYQGVSPTPSAHPAASSSNCQALPSITSS